MKKVILSLSLLFTLFVTASAQKATPFIQAGVSAGVDRILNENLEVGSEFGKNRVSLVGQSFNDSTDDRKFLVGVKFLRLVSLLPNLQGTISLAGKTRTDNVGLFTIEPGVGLNFDLGKGISFVTGVSSPITQTSFTNRQTTFAGNAGLKFNLR